MASISVAWPPRSGRADLCSFFVAVAMLVAGAVLTAGVTLTAGVVLLAGVTLTAEAVLLAGLWSLVLGTSLCIFKDPESKAGLEFIRSQSPVPSQCPAPSLQHHHPRAPRRRSILALPRPAVPTRELVSH